VHRKSSDSSDRGSRDRGSTAVESSERRAGGGGGRVQERVNIRYCPVPLRARRDSVPPGAMRSAMRRSARGCPHRRPGRSCAVSVSQSVISRSRPARCRTVAGRYPVTRCRSGSALVRSLLARAGGCGRELDRRRNRSARGLSVGTYNVYAIRSGTARHREKRSRSGVVHRTRGGVTVPLVTARYTAHRRLAL
jgi:hypothetical protein